MRLVQPLNIEDANDVIEDGISIYVSEVQPLNADAPMVVIAPQLTVVKELRPSNAELLIAVADVQLTVCRFVHPLNQLEPIVAILVIVAEVRPVQFRND